VAELAVTILVLLGQAELVVAVMAVPVLLAMVLLERPTQEAVEEAVTVAHRPVVRAAQVAAA
jgi:hypothetical protein